MDKGNHSGNLSWLTCLRCQKSGPTHMCHETTSSCLNKNHQQLKFGVNCFGIFRCCYLIYCSLRQLKQNKKHKVKLPRSTLKWNFQWELQRPGPTVDMSKSGPSVELFACLLLCWNFLMFIIELIFFIFKDTIHLEITCLYQTYPSAMLIHVLPPFPWILRNQKHQARSVVQGCSSVWLAFLCFS